MRPKAKTLRLSQEFGAGTSLTGGASRWEAALISITESSAGAHCDVRRAKSKVQAEEAARCGGEFVIVNEARRRFQQLRMSSNVTCRAAGSRRFRCCLTDKLPELSRKQSERRQAILRYATCNDGGEPARSGRRSFACQGDARCIEKS